MASSMSPILALSISDKIEQYGAYAGFASVLGLAVLSLLYFAQAREVKRLREWAGRAPERAAEQQERVIAEAQRRVGAPVPQQTAAPQPGPAQAPKPAAAPATAAGQHAQQPAGAPATPAGTPAPATPAGTPAPATPAGTPAPGAPAVAAGPGAPGAAGAAAATAAGAAAAKPAGGAATVDQPTTIQPAPGTNGTSGPPQQPGQQPPTGPGDG